MSAYDIEVKTCSNSLLAPGLCCNGSCRRPATKAVLLNDLIEHTWCDDHAKDHRNVAATKPLVWDDIWGPLSREETS